MHSALLSGLFLYVNVVFISIGFTPNCWSGHPQGATIYPIYGR